MTKEQWQAIKNKDSSYDGKFFYVLRSTGTICRPSCEKKIAEPKNVIIFESLEEALAAGYHTCRKCRPELDEWKGVRNELAEAAASYIKEHYTEDFSLDTLADSLHINKFYLLRTFKEITGDTLLAYHNKYRCEIAKKELEAPERPMSYIAFKTGFNSASHFTRVFVKVTGMTPSQYRKEYLKKIDED